jgi:hypothetical protein
MDLDGRKTVARALRCAPDDHYRIGSVQFVRFPVGSIDRGGLLASAEAGKLAIEVDHPSLAARAAIVGDLARALAQDLEGERRDGRKRTSIRQAQHPVDQFLVWIAPKSRAFP